MRTACARRAILLWASLSWLCAVPGAGCEPPAPDAPPAPPRPELAGPLTRAEIEAAVADWVESEVAVVPDRDAAARLAALGEGAAVEVYLGTWCSDSRRELARLWRHLDEAGGEAPFRLSYHGLVRDPARRPADLVGALALRYLPTFVVRRDGREVGRIVESSPGGIEHDLAALLAGEASGLVSGRDDLRPGE